jgi:hypothetical protein
VWCTLGQICGPFAEIFISPTLKPSIHTWQLHKFADWNQIPQLQGTCL